MERYRYNALNHDFSCNPFILGTFPNVTRNAIVNVSEIVCYDIIKDTILHYHLLEEGVPLHFSAAVVAGNTTPPQMSICPGCHRFCFRFLCNGGGFANRRGQDTLHEFTQRTIQRGCGLRRSDVRARGRQGLLQGIRPFVLQAGVLEHLHVADIRADETRSREINQ